MVKWKTFWILYTYMIVLNPVCTYRMQLRGCTERSNVLIIQRFQNKTLRYNVFYTRLWYVLYRNLTIHLEAEEIELYVRKHKEILHWYQNTKMLQSLKDDGLETETIRIGVLMEWWCHWSLIIYKILIHLIYGIALLLRLIGVLSILMWSSPRCFLRVFIAV